MYMNMKVEISRYFMNRLYCITSVEQHQAIYKILVALARFCYFSCLIFWSRDIFCRSSEVAAC